MSVRLLGLSLVARGRVERPAQCRLPLTEETTMDRYEFMVWDDDGFWGSVTQAGPTEREARAAVYRWLNRREQWPNGSLTGRVRLTLRATPAAACDATG